MTQLAEVVDIAAYRRAILRIRVQKAMKAAKLRAGPPKLGWTGLPAKEPSSDLA